MRRFASIAIDALLRIAFACSPRPYRRRDPATLDPRRVLFCRLDHIGDVVMALPALRALRQRLPRAHITMVVGSWAAELLRHNRDADQVLVADAPWWLAKRNPGLPLLSRLLAWRSFAARVLQIRRERYDLMLELRGDVRHIVALGCLGGVRHIVTCRGNGGHFLADAVLPAIPGRHEISRNGDLVGLLGAAPVSGVAPLHGEEDSLAVAGLLAEAGIDARHVLVVIHPGAKRVNQWPLEHYAALLPRLLSHPQVRVLVSGSSAEAPLADALCARAPARVHSLAGRVTLRQCAALLARADVFLGGDTGPMHLLNACATPALLLFGPTPPGRFAPLVASATVIAARQCCERALHERCLARPQASYSACMSSISPESVAGALAPMLERAGMKGNVQ